MSAISFQSRISPVIKPKSARTGHIRSQEAIERAFSEVLAELERAPRLPPEIARLHIMRATAELQYQLHGGSHCQLCSAHVRHVLWVTVNPPGGGTRVFSALCIRCLVAEEAIAESVTVSLEPPPQSHAVKAA